MAYTYGKSTYAKLYNASYDAYEVRVGYEPVSQSQEDNASKVNARLQVRTIDDTYQTWGYKQTPKFKELDSEEKVVQELSLAKKTFSVRETDTWVTFATQTLTLQHNEDGTYDGTIEGSFTTNGDFKWALLSGSASVKPDLPPIQRYSKIEEVTGEYLGSEVTVTLTRELDTYKHKIEYSFEGSEYVEGGTDIDTSCTFIPSLDLASQITDKTSGTLTIKVSTYLDGTKLGELTSTIALKIPDIVIPKIKNVTVSPLSNTVPSDWDVYVKGNSQVVFTIDAEGIYGSTIKSYSIVGANQSYSGEANTFTSEILNTAGTFEFVVAVTDTRDRQAEFPVEITVLDYAKPSISAVIKRCDSEGKVDPSGSYLSILANYSYSSIDGKNQVTKSVSINGVTVTDFENGKEYILDANLSPMENYTAVFSISDSLKYSSSVSYLSRKDTRVLNITKDKDGIAFNGFAESNKFKCNYPTDFMQDYACPIGQVLITSKPTPPSIGEWELIDKEFKPQIINSDNFTINSTNTTSATLTAILAGHTVDLNLQTVNKTTINDDEKTRGTINLEAIGLTKFPIQKGQLVGTSDGGNAWSTWTVATDGVVTTVDCDPSNSSVAAGSTNIIRWQCLIDDIDTMLDDYCNKFYWKRVGKLETPTIKLVEETVEE